MEPFYHRGKLQQNLLETTSFASPLKCPIKRGTSHPQDIGNFGTSQPFTPQDWVIVDPLGQGPVRTAWQVAGSGIRQSFVGLGPQVAR